MGQFTFLLEEALLSVLGQRDSFGKFTGALTLQCHKYSFKYEVEQLCDSASKYECLAVFSFQTFSVILSRVELATEMKI